MAIIPEKGNKNSPFLGNLNCYSNFLEKMNEERPILIAL